MHGVGVYTQENITTTRELSVEYSYNAFIYFRLSILHFVTYLFFIYRSPSSQDCNVLDNISDNIEMDHIPYIHPSAFSNARHFKGHNHSNVNNMGSIQTFNFSIAQSLTQISNWYP